MVFGTIKISALDSCNAVIPFTVSSQNDSEALVTVEIFPVDNAPLPRQSLISVRNGQRGEFVIPYNAVGNFRYLVRETASSDSNLILDNGQYRVETAVFYDEDGALSTAVTVYRNNEDEKSDEIVFENHFPAVPDSSSDDGRNQDSDTGGNGGNKKPDTPNGGSSGGTWSTPNTGMAVSVGTFSIVLFALVVIGISRRNNGNDGNENDIGKT